MTEKLSMEKRHGFGKLETGDMQCIAYSKDNHEPYNGGYYKNCWVEMKVVTCSDKGANWVEFHVEETTVTENGNRRSKVISFSMEKQHADQIADHILNGTFKYGEEIANEKY